MAEAIGVASGLVALATFAFQASVTLYDTVNSFQSHPKRVRDLMDEIAALSAVLGPLTETINAITDVDLSPLDLPLLRCGSACADFEKELIKCSSRSGGNRTSFRDWAKLRYMGDDIDEFRRLLAGYKLTITIALTDANLRKHSVNAEGLQEYRELIKTTTDDLESRLQSIDDKLETIFDYTVTESDADAVELRSIKEERMSTEKCLQICAQLSEHIDQIQLRSNDSNDSSSAGDPDIFPERVTNTGLQECKSSLASTAVRLEKHMQELMDRLITKSKRSMTSEDDIADLTRLRDEWETARQCMDICSKAEHHLKESVSIIDNYATGDAVQFMISTNGKTIHGKNRGLGWRSRQVGGHLSDVSLQQLSRDMTSITLRHADHGPGTSPRNSASPEASHDEEENLPVSEFKDRYGRGFKLTTKSLTATNISPPGPAPKR